jgi:hypothetical protein
MGLKGGFLENAASVLAPGDCGTQTSNDCSLLVWPSAVVSHHLFSLVKAEAHLENRTDASCRVVERGWADKENECLHEPSEPTVRSSQPPAHTMGVDEVVQTRMLAFWGGGMKPACYRLRGGSEGEVAARMNREPI